MNSYASTANHITHITSTVNHVASSQTELPGKLKVISTACHVTRNQTSRFALPVTRRLKMNESSTLLVNNGTWNILPVHNVRYLSMAHVILRSGVSPTVRLISINYLVINASLVIKLFQEMVNFNRHSNNIPLN